MEVVHARKIVLGETVTAELIQDLPILAFKVGAQISGIDRDRTRLPSGHLSGALSWPRPAIGAETAAEIVACCTVYVGDPMSGFVPERTRREGQPHSQAFIAPARLGANVIPTAQWFPETIDPDRQSV